MKLDGETRVEYFRIELKKIMVSSVGYQGASEDWKETVVLKFTEFKEFYTLQTNLRACLAVAGILAGTARPRRRPKRNDTGF